MKCNTCWRQRKRSQLMQTVSGIMVCSNHYECFTISVQGIKSALRKTKYGRQMLARMTQSK